MDYEGDGVIVGPEGPRDTTTRGFIQSNSVNHQGGLGLPSYNPEPDGDTVEELTGEDQRILRALGYYEVNTRE